MNMDKKEILRQRVEDLRNNPTPRVAVALCLDKSGSMNGAPIQQLNNGVKLFYQNLLDDEIARYSAEVCVVSFDNEATAERDFCRVETQTVPVLSTDRGATHMGEGVNLALDMLEARKAEYKQEGVDYYQPMLVLMTDGMPYGEDAAVTAGAMARVSQLVKEKKLLFIPVGIGDEADRETLQRFSPDCVPLKLQGIDFQKFFKWLSKSVIKVSSDLTGNDTTLPSPDWFQAW